ncbi:MAG: winged helix-turn-helix transcriptional regulator [Candidatus Thorarchaeota archaeon]|nr:winged helix-turn-helix transcriptional regulator [Candidatus Thorarchaeota archaeon]
MRILSGDDAVAAFHALNDESRRQILHALRAKRMTTSELVEFLDSQEPDKAVKPQTVRYHLKELEKCGLIEQDGYEPAGNGDSHIMQKIWRATAESIFIATGDVAAMSPKLDSGIKKSLDIMETIRRLGFATPEQPDIDRIIKEFAEWEELWTKGRQRALETLKSVSEIDPEVYIVLRRLLSVISLSDEEYARYWEISRGISDVLRMLYRAGHGPNPQVY